MSDYTITVKVPFSYDKDNGNITAVGLAYLLDAIAEHGMGGSVPEEVTIKVKRRS
jgi:hypothetical protein